MLVVAVLVLLPVGRSAEAPLALGALAGLVLTWRSRDTLAANAGLRLAALLFACYWLPALISAPDSVASSKSWSTVATLLRFLPFAAFAVLALRDARVWPRIVQAVAAVLVLWLLDAWVQACAGNLKLGPVLAVLAPFLLVAARDAFGLRGLVVAFVFMLVPVLLSGERAAWLMYGLVTIAMLWREARTPRRLALGGVALVLLVSVAMLATLHLSPAFEARVERSLLALHGSEQAVDEASAGRVRIWSTAARMIAVHPVNGVGVRAFRYAYPQYAGKNDWFVHPDGDEGALHAHQIVLEVLSETGTIGFIFWLAGVGFALRA
ncbi:MAG: O-antigen ligase family protein, partial [Gammaproteobacteria bacterium]